MSYTTITRGGESVTCDGQEWHEPKTSLHDAHTLCATCESSALTRSSIR